MCVHNTTPVADGLDRAAALRSSLLLDARPRPRRRAARFLSPIAPPEHGAAAVMACAAVNTFPVLATDDDTALLGAAIVLPDHPQIAPESRGDLFDATEIEEALLLHVLALSDAEREQIAEQDPAVRAMLERAVADDAGGHRGAARPRDGHGPPPPRDPGSAGEPRGARSTASPTAAAPRVRLRAEPARRRRTTCSPGAPRRSSGSTSTTTTACTSASPSTTTPARS